MGFTLRFCCLLLAFLACSLLHCHLGESIYIPPERCMCPEGNILILEPIETFFIKDKNQYCENTEIILTLKRNNQEVCLSSKGKQGQRLIKCWERINKDEGRKMMCIKQRK